MPYSFTELEKIAEYAESSGLFGGRGQKITKAQAMLRLLRGQEIGLPPTSALGGIWFSNGKMVLDAGTVAVLLRQNGYQLAADADDKRCAMTLRKDGKDIGTAQFSMDEAKQAGLVRDQSAWKGFPGDMLWARCITRLARRYAPEVFGGAVYTPGEIPDEQDAPQERQVPQMMPQPVASQPPGSDLGKALDELRLIAVEQLGLDRQSVRQGLLAHYGRERLDQLTTDEVRRFTTQRYEGPLALITELGHQHPQVQALREQYGAYGLIPWDDLLVLATPQPDKRQDGNAAADELFGTTTGLIAHDERTSEDDIPY